MTDAIQSEPGRWVCNGGPEADDPTELIYLDGQASLFGVPCHVYAFQVQDDAHYVQFAVGDSEALDHLHTGFRSDTGFQTTEIPGFDGEYVIFAFPHDR